MSDSIKSQERSSASSSPSQRADGREISGRSRPRASLACMSCRQRKIKCNKPNPSPTSICSSCKSLRVPCVISRDGDRRKTGSREQVAMLHDRVLLLESLMRQQQAANAHSDRKLSNVSSSASRPNGLMAGNADPAAAGMNSGSGKSPNLDAAPSHEMSAEASNLTPRTDSSRHMRRESTDRQSQHNLSTSDDLSVREGLASPPHTAADTELGRLTPLSEKNTSRLEVDNARGQSRYYGPTCQLYIQSRGENNPGDNIWADDDNPVEVKLDSTPLRSLLFQTFWKAQPLSQALIEQDRFQGGRNRALRSQWYSPFLENVILACATRMSTSANVRALGPRYAAHAKAAVAAELENPNIASLQGFLLLSDFEATRGKDRLGYMYCSIACRLAFDLGLHENCDELIARGKLASSEALSRYVLFLGTFVYDALWTLYLGRPSAIPVDFLTAANRCAANHGWSIPPTLEAWVGLSSDISKATKLLNGAFPMDPSSFDRLAELDAKIHERAIELPPWLALRDDAISELDATVYGLHVQFCGIRILLHKLLTQATQSQNPSPGNEQALSNLERSRAVMYDNAMRIARLVSAYQQIFGIENVITVMLDNMYVAAAVLVSHINRQLQLNGSSASTSPAVDRDVRWLRSLADMLLQAQRHYPVTARMRSTLANLVRDTPLAGMFGSWTHGGANHVRNSGGSGGVGRQGPLSASNETTPSAGVPETPQVTTEFVGGGTHDLMFTEDPFAVHDPQGFQDMDIRNMMSWVLTE